MMLIPALFGALWALGGCVRPPPPPPPVAHRDQPVYRGEPAPPPVETSNQPVRPARPLPVPPEPVTQAAATACAPAGSAELSEARKQQLFKEFSHLESGKQNGATTASAAPPAQAGPPPPPPCSPAH